ncbi:major facilitator superfamily domain-containing protein [Glomus cerebriforme]|uniref:Major facilitator superfamily domain-containing protein n=1 Tax=Glomus cerebriforme TaxID=658196 RepID=A0A397SWB4_9GLOM|nr:major facilitator superfamily domain-containing protein [Glomus cerebriforme]
MATRPSFDNVEIETHLPLSSSLPNKKPWYKTASAYWLLPMFIIISITGGLTVATGVQLYLKAVCHEYYSKKHLSIAPFSLKPISPDDVCNNADVQSVTSKFLAATNLCTAIPAIFVLGPLGILSDRKGRKRTLLISSAGTILSTLVLIFVSNFLETFGIYCFLIGPLIDGLTGGFYAISEASYAYATDCTHPTRRSVVFGWIQGAMFAGFAIGPTIGAWLVKITDSLLSVNYVILVVYIILFLFYLFILPESLSKEKLASNLKRQQDIRSRQKSWIISFLYRIFGALLVFLPPKQHNDDDKIPINFTTKYSSLILAVCYTLLSASIMAFTGVFVLYTSLVFKWTLLQQGYFVFMMGATKVVVLFILYPAIVRFKKPILALISSSKKLIIKRRNNDKQSNNNNNIAEPEEKTEQHIVVNKDDGNDENINNNNKDDENINNNDDCNDNKDDDEQMRKELIFEVWVIRLIFLIDTLAHIMYGIATTGSVFTGATVIAALGIITTPAIKSLQTNLIPPSQIGRLLGAISVIDSILRIVVPPIFDGLYSVFVKTSPHLIWYCMSVLLILAFLFAFGIGPATKKL